MAGRRPARYTPPATHNALCASCRRCSCDTAWWVVRVGSGVWHGGCGKVVVVWQYQGMVLHTQTCAQRQSARRSLACMQACCICPCHCMCRVDCCSQTHRPKCSQRLPAETVTWCDDLCAGHSLGSDATLAMLEECGDWPCSRQCTRAWCRPCKHGVCWLRTMHQRAAMHLGAHIQNTGHVCLHMHTGMADVHGVSAHCLLLSKIQGTICNVYTLAVEERSAC
jgi:hypothetical protein